MTLDLNGCEFTVGTNGTDPIEIWPSNHVTIKDGKIKTFFSWRGVRPHRDSKRERMKG